LDACTSNEFWTHRAQSARNAYTVLRDTTRTSCNPPCVSSQAYRWFAPIRCHCLRVISLSFRAERESLRGLTVKAKKGTSSPRSGLNEESEKPDTIQILQQRRDRQARNTMFHRTVRLRRCAEASVSARQRGEIPSDPRHEASPAHPISFIARSLAYSAASLPSRRTVKFNGIQLAPGRIGRRRGFRFERDMS